MEKEFKTIDEQIELLQNRNLHIENKNIARKILLKNNYYYLINGYKDILYLQIKKIYLICYTKQACILFQNSRRNSQLFFNKLLTP